MRRVLFLKRLILFIHLVSRRRGKTIVDYLVCHNRMYCESKVICISYEIDA